LRNKLSPKGRLASGAYEKGRPSRSGLFQKL
jgi:hypothetical protein